MFGICLTSRRMGDSVYWAPELGLRSEAWVI
jgi:hypothetical protein